MNAVDMGQLIDALTKIAAVLNSLGVPGLVGLALCGPAAVLCTLLAIDYHRSRKFEALVEAMRAENSRIMEMHRGDIEKTVRELGNNQKSTARYYENNVELVKQVWRMAEGYQDIVIGNTRALERLATILETRNHL